METILIIAVVGALNVACFFIGSRIGQKVAKGESIDLPNINPMEKIQERREQKQAKAEKERTEIILQNIDNYNGTSAGQKDVPRR